jgi:hypothetical protein
MPFGSFKNLAEAIRTLQVTEVREAFVVPLPLPVPDYFRADLETTQELFDVDCSEWAVCENLLYPVFRQVAKGYADVLGVWSHVSLYNGEELVGVPDYIIGKRSPLSKRVMEIPFALIMEAKRNDFDLGWAQCLAAMCVVQTLNGDPQRVIYGGVSDGFIWRFGKLQGRTFAHHPQSYALTRLDELFGALNHVLSLCKLL